MAHTIRRVRHTVKSLMDGSPTYLFVSRLRPGTRSLTTGKGTEIVIEGFPRSANTFATTAFAYSQGRPVTIARHLHAPSQIIAAVRRSIPAIVLIRYPKDAILSSAIRSPHISVRQSLKDYIRFYSSVLPHVESVVVARFEDVVVDFGTIISRVNKKFGTDFNVFEHNDANVEECMKMIERMDVDDTKASAVQERTVARPSEERNALRIAFAACFDSSQARLRLSEAVSIYTRFVDR